MKYKTTFKLVTLISLALMLGTGLGSAAYGAKKNDVSGQNLSMSDCEARVIADISKQDTLYKNMRKLWIDHVIWTRQFILCAVDNTPGLNQATNRLMKNQEDIGNAIASYYGEDAGAKLTDLLKEHIKISGDVVASAKANDKDKLKDASDRWSKNSDDIAIFLSQANKNWPKDAMSTALTKHLQTTKAEAMARINKDYNADVRAFDAVFDHIVKMADILSDGIIKQFPKKF